MTKESINHANKKTNFSLVQSPLQNDRRSFLALTLTTVTLLGSAFIPFSANADTVTKTTIVESKDIPNVNKIDFMSFDVNHDGRLSIREVGDVLFGAFDTDKNGAIDNIEYDKNSVYTVIPMESTTLTFVDYDDDGHSDVYTVSKDEFLERSNLMRFDKDMDGLSPRDFMGSEVKEMDLNHNNLIEKDEWQRKYALIVKPKSSIGKRYNH
ncbi:MAG: hypothetical protein JNL76_05375 [Alphaproteobacteria bacterium]|nr:hypothetical protein [Alphaproteobacteria bacterium]